MVGSTPVRLLARPRKSTKVPVRKKAPSAYHHGDLRNAAIAAAMAHIARTGDTGFTLRELAAMLRVTSTALYRHFPSKLAILAAIAEAGFLELTRRARTHEARAAQDPIDALARHGMDYVGLALESPATFRVMFHGGLTDLEAFPELRAARDGSYDALRAAVARCERAGVLRPGLSVDDVSLAMWTAAHGTASLMVDKQLSANILKIEGTADALASAGKLLQLLGRGMFEARSQDAAIDASRNLAPRKEPAGKSKKARR